MVFNVPIDAVQSSDLLIKKSYTCKIFITHESKQCFFIQRERERERETHKSSSLLGQGGSIGPNRPQ